MLLNEMNPSNNIFLIDCQHLLTDDFCEKLINYINDTDIFQIEKVGFLKNVICKYVHLNDDDKNEIKCGFLNQVENIITFIIEYIKTEKNVKCNGNSLIALRKIYGPTKLHIDSIIINPIDKKYISIDKIRKMSIIMALNDDYEGGEFYFPLQDYKIKLKKGQIIAFPPYWTHPHMVFAPTNNTYRYTLNTWLYE